MKDWNSKARLLGYESEKEMLTSLYTDEEFSLHEIASRLNCGHVTIAGRLTFYQIERRARGGANNTHRLSRILFRMDQRVVFGTKLEELAKLLQAHSTTIYKYRRGVQSL